MGGELALVLVGVLFVLAIVSPRIFPNKKVSDNRHDVEGTTKEQQ